MENMPLVSVLICAYNAAPYLKESMTAVINQTYRNLEIIVVEDGSTDDTLSILQDFARQDLRIHIVQNEQNMGLISSLNKGLEHVHGKYIARTDADDITEPQWVEKIVSELEKRNDIVAMGAYIRIFSEKGNGSKLAKFNQHNSIVQQATEPQELERNLLFHTPFHHPTVIMRAQVVQQHGLRYNKDYPHAEDYRFWADISRYGKLANYPEPLLNYRLHANQVSSKYNDAQIRTTQKIRREIWLERIGAMGIDTSSWRLDISSLTQFIGQIRVSMQHYTQEQQELLQLFLYYSYLSLDDKTYSFAYLVKFLFGSEKRFFTKRQSMKIIKKFIRPYKYSHFF